MNVNSFLEFFYHLESILQIEFRDSDVVHDYRPNCIDALCIVEPIRSLAAAELRPHWSLKKSVRKKFWNDFTVDHLLCTKEVGSDAKISIITVYFVCMYHHHVKISIRSNKLDHDCAVEKGD